MSAQNPFQYEPTHEVLNQVKPLEDYNLFSSDAILTDAFEREGEAWAKDSVTQFGARVGSKEVYDWGFKANEHLPILKTHDTLGNRLDLVEFNPAWHQLMSLSIAQGNHSLPWSEPRKSAYVARTAAYFMMCQIEAGHCCPVTMTTACLPVISMQPEVANDWKDKILSAKYDPRLLPMQEKQGVTCGMAMTEKQGGSDVRANTTIAKAMGKAGPGQEYLLSGHKWFCSAPMSDAFLVLAQTDKGLSCYFMPRFLPDGTKNNIFIQRLSRYI